MLSAIDNQQLLPLSINLFLFRRILTSLTEINNVIAVD
jgi:hypothetical protein